MYKQFFSLRERPFELTPNLRYLYLTPRHREALGNLQYGISGRKGVTLLIGEAGTGKTTIIRAAIDMLAAPAVRCVYLSNPALTRTEFYEFLAARFGLSDSASRSKTRLLFELEDVLLAARRSGGTTALIVDEAQSLPHELMEEVRLLANLETADEKLLQVVLAGQPELADRLDHESLRQLKQRVALRCELLPLDVHGTAAYIAGRVSIAGGNARLIFTREAVRVVHEASQGIPRTISVICDNALVTAFAAGVRPVDESIIREVCRDFRLEAAGQPANGNGHGNGRGQAIAAQTPAPPVVATGQAAPAEQTAAAPAPQAAPANGTGGRGDDMFSSYSRKKRFLFF